MKRKHPNEGWKEARQLWIDSCRQKNRIMLDLGTVVRMFANWWRDSAANKHGWDAGAVKAKRAWE